MAGEDETREAAQAGPLTNGTPEKVGELRGELRSVVRELGQVHNDYCAVQVTLAETNKALEGHIAYHKGVESVQSEKKAESRWRGQIITGLAGGSIGSGFMFLLTKLFH